MNCFFLLTLGIVITYDIYKINQFLWRFREKNEKMKLIHEMDNWWKKWVTTRYFLIPKWK